MVVVIFAENKFIMMTKRILMAFSFLWLSNFAAAQMPEVFSTEEGAIRGYDVVAFFKESRPVKGDSQYTVQWNVAEWRFSSKENMEAFQKNPSAYAPQYGGYCAYGTADGHKSPTLPETWTILNNKLYFNYNMKVKERWDADRKGYIEKADKNWPGLKGK